MALQPRMGILPQRRSRFDCGDCDYFAFDGSTLENERCFGMRDGGRDPVPPFLFEMN